MYQANIAKFDPKTEKFTQWSVPKEWQTDAAQTGHLAVNATHVDGKVWIKNSDETNIYRLDVATGKFEDLGNQTDPFNGRRIGTYGIHSDSQNNAYLLDFSSNNLVRIDAKTKALKFYQDADRDVAAAPRQGGLRRTACGSRSMAATPSACSIRSPATSRNGKCRRRGARRMTRSSTSTATPGPAPC